MTTTIEGKSHTKNGFKRLVFVILSILIEGLFLLAFGFRFTRLFRWVSIGVRIIAFLLVLIIFNQNKTSAMKTPWIVLIMAVPLVGISLYLLIGLNVHTSNMKKRYAAIDEKLLPLLFHDEQVQADFRKEEEQYSALSDYLDRYSGYPIYKNTDVAYYSEAADGLDAQLEDLKKAEDFIFMEYHAIEDKESFHRVEKVLLDRVRAGVEVRLFYDDIGSIFFIDTDFVKRMEAKGIHCRVFNPFAPGLNLFLNNRDHRKITVIDGKVGYTGGYNIADEYFNVTHPYGYWKDTGIRIEGDAVRSLTITFLEMWNAIKGNDIDDEDFERYLKKYDYTAKGSGYIQPYADNPMDDEHVGENVYADIASGAREYVYFVSPYLIITDEMSYVLGMAAKNGVDVRIITPGIPDKKIVYALTRSYYSGLIRNGVRIFEYKPGFCHCKMSVADNVVATCGTINLDYRSLYHHFENGCVMYRDPSVMKIKEDFDDMFSQCEEVTEKYRNDKSSLFRIGHLILRFFAPLL